MDTLHKIDAVFLDNLDGTDELTKNIKKDGVVIMNRFETKLNNFKKASAALDEEIEDFDNR